MANSEHPKVLFREDQQFRQPLLWIIVVIFAAFVLGTAFFLMRRAALGAPESAGLPWQTWLLLLLFVVLPVGLTMLVLALTKLQVEVSTAGLFVRFFPFHRRVHMIDLSGIASVETVTYNSVLEYGGYGIRRLPRAKAYNTGGNQGVRIHYANGYHLLLGTQYPAELQAAIAQVLPEASAADADG
ncbi:MAG: hypothetical protein HYZ00_00385 [Candidatus Hydrogenedentes bacterium]|nr:hypothetical protein [Candidatus Hydrogenedentota bacterium]